MDAKELFDAGKLTEALELALADVKKDPTDIGKRAFLCELMCFSGQLERADKQLDLMGDQAPDAMMAIALFRQLIRAETSRQEFFNDGRVPEFVGLPTDSQKLCLEANISIREGDSAGAAKLLAEAEEKRVKASGECDGSPFSDWRDLDDRIPSSFEVLTTNGKYYWIPVEKVVSIEFRPPEAVRDLLWRAAEMIVRDGPEGEVYLPVLYPGSADCAGDEQLRLGRATDWQGDEGQPVTGIGQRMYLIGEDDHPIMTLKNVDFKCE